MKAFEKFLILVIFLSGAFTLRSLVISQKSPVDIPTEIVASRSSPSFLSRVKNSLSHVYQMTEAEEQKISTEENLTDVNGNQDANSQTFESYLDSIGFKKQEEIVYPPEVQNFIDIAEIIESQKLYPQANPFLYKDDKNNIYMVTKNDEDNLQSLVAMVYLGDVPTIVTIHYNSDGSRRKISADNFLNINDWVQFDYDGSVEESHIQKDL